MKPQQAPIINHLMPIPSEVPKEETIECNDIFLDNSIFEERLSIRTGSSRLLFANEINLINSIPE